MEQDRWNELNYEGKCSVCGSYNFFQRENKSVRETFKCKECRASLREREQASAILSLFQEESTDSLKDLCLTKSFKEKYIYEPGIIGSFRQFLKKLPNYTQSFYWENIPLGSYKDGIQCQDLTKLTFPDQSFDIIITSDILEHIRKPQVAFEEIYRVLVFGGYHVFSIPVPHPMLKFSRYRYDTSGLEDIPIFPPVYHGNGAGGRSPVYTDFGQDIQPMLESIGFSVTINDQVSSNMNIKGVYTFITRKSSGHVPMIQCDR